MLHENIPQNSQNNAEYYMCLLNMEKDSMLYPRVCLAYSVTDKLILLADRLSLL